MRSVHPEVGTLALRAIASANTELGVVKLAAGNDDHCLALAPMNGVCAAVAGGGVLVRFRHADS